MKRAFTSALAFAAFACSITSCSDSPSGPPAVASLALTVPDNSPRALTSQTLVAVPRAADGTELRGRVVTWASNNAVVANVDAAGTVTANSVGTANITATSEGKLASAVITVQPAAVESVVIVNPEEPIIAGDSRLLIARPLNARGEALSDRVMAWSSSNVATATVTAEGLLTAVLPGTATITATSEGKAAMTTLVVLPVPDPPEITSIMQTALIPGMTATINGLRFHSNTSNNRVMIRGVDAPVLSGTSTQLIVTVPCVNSGAAGVQVVAAGRTSPVFAHPLNVTARTIPVGQALILSSSATSACNELAGLTTNARYLVAVFSASTSQNTLVNFEIAGNTPPVSALAAGNTPAVVTARPVVTSSAARTHDEAADATRDESHWQHLERDRAEFERLQQRAKLFPAQVRPLRDVVLPALGDPRPFFFTFGMGCADTTRTMKTKAVYVGSRAIIWEDEANTMQSAVNPDLEGYYLRLGQIFDQDQYQSLRDNFGDPLLRDNTTDGDQRVHMVFSQRLNGSGAAAYVTSCDQFPRTVAAGSNFGEVFYGFVPLTAGSNLNSSSFADGWFYFMARTVVHEVKHIVSIGARVQNGAPVFEASWLEEGTARHAEEVWIRESLHRVPWKGNTGFGTAATNGVFCDFHPADTACNAADILRRPGYGMRRQFNEIRDKLLAPWDWSPYGDGTSQSGSVFYQTAWSLVRYTIDRYAQSDAAFFKALINSNTNGTTNLAATAGTSLDQLIGGWGLALYADDYPGLTQPSADLQFPTWNLRNIYAGLNASPNWTTRFNSSFPIKPTQAAFGIFTFSQNGLRGGAHAYFELSGASPALQLIHLRGAGGSALPGNTRIAIARLQ